MARVAVKQLGLSRNYLINGNFDFWQRIVSNQLLVSTNAAYGADRWKVFPSTTTGTAAQMIRAISTNIGSQYDMNFGPWSANEKCAVAQIVEFQETKLLRGKDVTFSFDYRSFSNGAPIRVELLAWTGTADTVTAFTNVVPYTNWTTYSLAANFTSLVSTTSSGLTTYQQVSLNATVPNNTNNLICVISYNENGGNQIFISQTMLNEGLGPQEFSLYGGNLVSELTACQKFYEKSWQVIHPPGTNTFDGMIWTNGASTGRLSQSVAFKTQKRVFPSVRIYDSVGNADKVRANGVDNQGSLGVTLFIRTGATALAADYSAAGLSELLFHWVAESEL